MDVVNNGMPSLRTIGLIRRFDEARMKSVDQTKELNQKVVELGEVISLQRETNQHQWEAALAVALELELPDHQKAAMIAAFETKIAVTCRITEINNLQIDLMRTANTLRRDELAACNDFKNVIKSNFE